MKSILHVTTLMSLPPVGGIEIVTYNLAYHLAKRGYKTTILCSGERNNEVSISDSLKIVYIKSLILNSNLTFPYSIDKIIEEVIKHDVVHIHFVDSILGILAFLIALIYKKKIVVSVLAYLEHYKCLKYIIRMPLRIFMDFIILIIIELADIVHVKNIGDLYKVKKITENVVLIPDGIPELYFTIPKKFHKSKGSKEHIVLYVGRLDRLKGLETLVKAANIIINEQGINDIKFVIVGAYNKFYYKLKRMVHNYNIEDYFYFTGYLKEDQKIRIYDIADIVVIPSVADYVEAFSLVASEAWARGKKVIASRAGALKYRVKENENGHLFNPSDPNNLARKIMETVYHNTHNNFPLPKDTLSWQKVADIFIKLYNTILRSR